MKTCEHNRLEGLCLSIALLFDHDTWVNRNAFGITLLFIILYGTVTASVLGTFTIKMQH